jgi:hypothetical protein
MAGKIIADIIEAPAGRISLNVANVTVASINTSGLYSGSGNLMINSAGTIVSNTAISGLIARNQLFGRVPELVMLTGTSSATTMATVGSYYKVTWDNELYDPLSAFSSSTFTCAATGTYLIEVETNFRLNNTGDVGQNVVYKNGSASSNLYEQGISDSNGQTNLHYTYHMSLTAGDTVEIYARWTGGGSNRSVNNHQVNSVWAIWRLS